MKATIPFLLCLLTTLLLESGCQKPNTDLKTPTQLGIRLGLGADYQPPADGLSLTEGYVRLTRIALRGERVEGEPFQFERQFEGGLTVDFNAAQALEDLVFDVPMGDYKHLIATLEAAPSAGNSVAVYGEYEWIQPTSAIATVAMTWERACRWEIDLLAGSQNRMLDEQAQAPRLVFQPYAWLATTDPNKWDRADYTTSAQGRLMRINALHNTNLFGAADPLLGTFVTTQW